MVIEWLETKGFQKKDGLWYKKSAKFPFTGTVEGFFEGQLETKTNLKNGKEHSWEQFHQNGELWLRQNYKNGQRCGPREYFYENGKRKTRVKFKKKIVKCRQLNLF